MVIRKLVKLELLTVFIRFDHLLKLKVNDVLTLSHSLLNPLSPSPFAVLALLWRTSGGALPNTLFTLNAFNWLVLLHLDLILPKL